MRASDISNLIGIFAFFDMIQFQERRLFIIVVPSRERSDFERIRRELDGHDARLPVNRADKIAFVQLLIRALPTTVIPVISKPGFVNGATGFVMPTYKLGAAGKLEWDPRYEDLSTGKRLGTLADYNKHVLKPALASPFLCCAILFAMWAPLTSFVEQRDKKGNLIPETAIFHLVGESSSGKTLIARVAMSVFGASQISVDYGATERGISEAAYASNDLVLVIDDTEAAALGDRELLSKMNLFAQRIPSGRSKQISRSAAAGAYPALTWSCFAISTGPESQAAIAARIGAKRYGERVRFIDLELPSGELGGIFGSDLIGPQGRVADAAKFIENCREGRLKRLRR